MTKVITVLLSLAASVLASILAGWVLSMLWGWFVVPLGAPRIGVAWAIGLCIVARLFTNSLVDNSKREVSDLVIHSVIYSLVALGWGAIIHAFM